MWIRKNILVYIQYKHSDLNWSLGGSNITKFKIYLRYECIIKSFRLLFLVQFNTHCLIYKIDNILVIYLFFV